MDWSNWQPRERANLCFVVRDGRILLIRKKRGLGAGKINGPGGRIERGESARDSAIRELQEELCIRPLDPAEMGELHFQFTDGHSIHCTVFRAEACEGEPVATEEADPLWTDLDAIPYGEMWEDDRHWLPHLISGRPFRGWFVFEGGRMLQHRMEVA